MKYYIIAGEASGDMHGSNLIRELFAHDSNAEIRYWGGDEMEKACREQTGANRCVQVRHIKELAYMGFVEVALHLKTILGNISFCKKDILGYRPDAIIYIDYPGFNLKIAKFAHSNGFKNYHYISPQLWAWKKGRIKTMRKIIDRLFCILPFEEKFYAQNRFPQAEYVGHPLLDAIAHFTPEKLQFESELPIIALLPGSRKQELKKILPSMLALAKRHTEYRFVIAGMSLIGADFYKRYCEVADNLSIVFDKTYSLLAQSHAAVVCSGTATLETALFDIPQVVCYRANALSIALAKFFVGKRVKYISLVNLIADKPVVAELIQDIDTHLEEEFDAIANDTDCRKTMLENYRQLRILLGNAGASAHVAKRITQDLFK